MKWIIANIKWIMLVSGALTCTMLYMAVSPQEAMRTTFGATLEGPLAEIIVRSWGTLIVLVGAMLIYGAYRPAARRLILTVAAAGKLVFIGLLLNYGRQYLDHAGVVLASDSLMVVLFTAYLIGVRRN